MKISVVLEKKSKFNIDLAEPEAKGLYKKIISSIVEALKPQPIVVNPTVEVSNTTVETAAKLISEKLQHTIEKVEAPKEPTLVNKKMDVPEFKKQLIMVKCPSCGEIATPVLYVKDGELMYKNKVLTCRHCQGDLPIGELKPARYLCPNCGTSASFYVMGELKETHCRNCKSIIDLQWNDKKKQYVSANLIK
jgi:predicted RNA-binding Zn-ribbon protein involved in translation (DUF1610 family)